MTAASAPRANWAKPISASANSWRPRLSIAPLGSPEPLLTGSNKRQGSWAEALDVIAREFKVLLVVSAGNHDTPIARVTSEAETALTGYPDYLFEPAAGLCDPATAAIPITVGALAEHETPEVRRSTGKDDIIRPVAKANEPGGWQCIEVPSPGHWSLQLSYEAREVELGLGISVIAWAGWLISVARMSREKVRRTTVSTCNEGEGTT